MATQPFDFTPTLVGQAIRLRPLRSDDFKALHAAASDPEIWAQHPDPVRWQEAVFRERFFDPAIASGGAFAVLDQDKRIIGSSRFYDWQPESAAIAVGYTFLCRAHWGGATNAELKRLMLRHAFLWVDRVWFHIGASNQRSRRALEKIGGQFSHLAEVQVNGVVETYAYYWIDPASERLGIGAG